MVSTESTFITVAPLPTIWTPPASCASQLPIIQGGECASTGCFTWSSEQVMSSFDAWANFGWWTIGPSQTSTDCWAPSSQIVVGFTFSPAVGCPVGHTTAKTLFGSYDNDVTAICCPSGYDTVSSWYKDDMWVCESSITQPVSMNVIAFGRITVYDVDGYSSYWYNSVSTISTSLIQPVPTAPIQFGSSTDASRHVSARAIAMVIPSSTSTSSSSVPSDTSDAAAKASSTTTTIGTIVGIIISTIFWGAIIYCCCIRPCRRRRAGRHVGILDQPTEIVLPLPSSQPVSASMADNIDHNSTSTMTSLLQARERLRRIREQIEAEEARRRMDLANSQHTSGQSTTTGIQGGPTFQQAQSQVAPASTDNLPSPEIRKSTDDRAKPRVAGSRLKSSQAMRLQKAADLAGIRQYTARGKDTKIKVRYGSTQRNSLYAQMFDLGPQNPIKETSEPQASNEIPAFATQVTPAHANEGSPSGMLTDNDKFFTQTLISAKLTVAGNSNTPEPDYSGIQDQGPNRGSVHFNVPISEPQPSQPPRQQSPKPRMSKRNSGRFPVIPSSPTENSFGFQQDLLAGRGGLRDSQPRFLVPIATSAATPLPGTNSSANAMRQSNETDPQPRTSNTNGAGRESGSGMLSGIPEFYARLAELRRAQERAARAREIQEQDSDSDSDMVVKEIHISDDEEDSSLPPFLRRPRVM